MTRARPIVTAVAVGATTLFSAVAQTPPPARPQQVFRTGVDVVMVDVSVRDGGRAVTGLRAEDFEVRDNGAKQRIESVEATSVPIDLTLVVDVSGNPLGAPQPRRPPSAVKADLGAEISRVARVLRRGDRLRVLGIDRDVQQLLPMQPVSAFSAIGEVQFDGLSALYETLAAALLYPVEPARRHVIIARTKGLDTISSIDAQAVRAIAERSDALFHLVIMETALDNDAAVREFQCGLAGLCWPSRRFWVPLRRLLVGGAPAHPLLRDGQILAAGAEATGGGLHKTEVLAEPTLLGTFRKAFEDFRNSYVLRYTPAGDNKPGWHAIDVKVRASNSYTVRHRNGYFVEGAPPAAPPVVVPEVPRTLPELTAAYEAGAYRPVLTGLHQAADPARLIRQFLENGNPWPAAPHKESAFVLELAEPALFSSRAATRQAGYDLLARFSRLVRHPLEPDAFERYWYFAALTMLEGSIQPAATERFADRALERFPDEPRFVLSHAIAIDQQCVKQGGTPSAVPTSPEQTDAVRRAYEAAITFPATAIEAHVRLAFFLHRVRQHDAALRHLTDAGRQAIADPALRYLRQLFLGHVLWALGRRDEAMEAYRAALVIVPGAQSARVSLMNALLMNGAREAAETIGEQIQSQGGDGDPWWMYWQGQYRLESQAMALVRKASR